jgi:hypothetical protein
VEVMTQNERWMAKHKEVLKEDRVKLFQKLLELGKRFKKVNQYT